MLLGQTSPAPPTAIRMASPTNGKTAVSNSVIRMDQPTCSILKALGALPAHKDIIVWIDWIGDETIPGTPPTTHNHQPMDAALAEVKAAFATAVQFTSNPDHTTGVHVITIVSPTPVSHKDMLGSGDPTDGTLWNDFDAKVQPVSGPAQRHRSLLPVRPRHFQRWRERYVPRCRRLRFHRFAGSVPGR